MLKKEKAAQIMESLCNDSSHGYSQVNRWGPDYDCSSAVITSFRNAGINVGSASYTGNMRSEFTKTGNFVWHPMSSGFIARRGDVYLSERNHTAMCVSDKPDLLAEFSQDENGGITGKQKGDQTGRESYIHAYYNYPWDGILECVNKETYGGGPTPTPTPVPSGNIDVTYAVMIEGGRVLPFVKNTEDYAGIKGKKIVGFACKVSQGSVKYRVHVIEKGWYEYVTGCNFSDFENGYAGDGRTPIDLIEVYLYSLKGDKYMAYKVSPVGKEYYPKQLDNIKNANMDGYAGDIGIPIDRVQMWVE